MSSSQEPEPRAETPAPAHTDPTRPPTRAFSLATRLTLWYTASTLALVLVVTGMLYFALAANVRRGDTEELREEVQILRALMADSSLEDARLQWEVRGEYGAVHPARLHKRILDPAGRTLLETPGMTEGLPTDAFPPPPPASDEPTLALSTVERDEHPWLIASSRVRLGTQERILQLGMELSRERALLSRYRRRLWAVLLLALATSVVVGRYIARRGIRPVERITETARRIRSTTLDERIETERLPAELAALAATFNEMLDRLEESFERLSRFSADIAHELRTPIQNMRGGAEVALGRPRPGDEYREALVSSLEECEGLSRLIDSLLFLARAESPQSQIDREPVDVAEELESVRAFYDAAAGAAGVSLSVECASPLPARIDRTLLQRAVANLVGTALAATPRGGTVRLSARPEPAGVQVEVADTGTGIPSEVLPRVFDRFYRIDGSRTKSSGGSGLGLAIVKCIAEMHGGSIAIASAPGTGTRVTVHLASPAPAAMASPPPS